MWKYMRDDYVQVLPKDLHARLTTHIIKLTTNTKKLGTHTMKLTTHDLFFRALISALFLVPYCLSHAFHPAWRGRQLPYMFSELSLPVVLRSLLFAFM